MEKKDLERRTCLRFVIPGATISYRLNKNSSEGKYAEEFCPMLDMSRGGLRFFCQVPFKVGSKISLKLSVPGERIPLTLLGLVRWAVLNPGQSYKYQIGVQFFAYGEKKDQNYPGLLVKIIALEQKFAQTEKIDGKDSLHDKFEMDS